jgi:hypothetical protein
MTEYKAKVRGEKHTPLAAPLWAPTTHTRAANRYLSETHAYTAITHFEEPDNNPR